MIDNGPRDNITLTKHCTLCNTQVELIDGVWCCDCYAVDAYRLSLGRDPIPDFWEEDDVPHRPELPA